MSYILLIFAVLTGALLVLVIKPNNILVRLLLAFSGAYLLSVTVLHLLPEVYQHNVNTKITGVLILFSPSSFMMAPFPNCFSIVERARSSAFFACG